MDEIDNNIIDNDLGMQKQMRKRTSFPTITAVLLFVVAILSIISSISLFSINETVIQQLQDTSPQYEALSDFSYSELKSVFNVCAVIGIIISILSVLGGIFSIKRKMWGIVVVACLLGLFSLFLMIIPGILALVALILTILSREEYQKGNQGFSLPINK